MVESIKGTARFAWRMIVIVFGFSILAIGVAMIVLPGPAFIVIPVALGILATEFVWAARLLKHIKARAGQAAAAVRRQASG